jgi:hypothetical protein
MAGSTRSFREDLIDLASLALTTFRKRAGWGYITLARIGLGIVTLGVSVLVPGLLETLLNWFIVQVSPAGQQGNLQIPLGVQVGVAVSLAAVGIALIILSAWLYHKHTLGLGPTTEKDGTISVNVQPETPFRGLVEAVADKAEKSVNFSGLSSKDEQLKVTPGLLKAPDFDDFLTQVAARTQPPLNLSWTRSGNFYTLQKA